MKRSDDTESRVHGLAGRGGSALQLQTLSADGMRLDLAMVGDDPWFHAPCLAQALEFGGVLELLSGMPDDEIRLFRVSSSGDVSAGSCAGAEDPAEVAFLNEPGFYRAIVRSRSGIAEPLKRWFFQEILPSLRGTGQFKLIQEAKRYGICFDFTEVQWDWLKLHPWMLDILPLAAAGFNSIQISQMLNYNTPSGITARKQIEKLKELGFLPKEILPRAQQLEQRIKAEQVTRQGR